MKLDKLWIGNFKNLKDFSIDFDEASAVTVLIGWNGTGKSNLFEALVVIFRDLDMGEPTPFAYKLEYICHDNLINIDNDPARPAKERLKKRIDPLDPLAGTSKQYLPAFIFGYYSGPSNRLQEHFLPHQRRYYDEVVNLKKADAETLTRLKSLRRLFFADDQHSKFVLLSFFLKHDPKIDAFLRDYLRIVGLESVLFIMKKPSWKSKEGDPRFWNARGLVQQFLDRLFAISLAPMRLKHVVPTGISKRAQQEFLYLYVKDAGTLASLAEDYETPSDFFASLESTNLSEVIHDVQIKVHIRNYDGTLTFRELSEGEQQLLMVLGLLRFTKEKESLILLDEPDTHLNPYWNVQYLNILKRIVDDDTDALNPERDTRHIIMSSHDPLVIADLERQQVQILKRDEVMDRCYADIPEMSPRGMGITGILTSDMFCFRSDLDPHTLALLDKKVELSGREGKLTKEDTDHLEKINEELDQAGLLMAFSDPYYSAFVRAWSQRPELKRFQKRFLTREERRELSAITDEILQEIMEEHEDSEKRGKMAVEIDDPGVAGNKERVIQEETVAISDMIREFWHLETQDPDAAVNRFVILFVHILLQYAQEPSRSRQRIWLRARDIVLEHLRTQVHKSHKFGRISFPLEEQDRSLEMLLDELIQSMNKPDISTPARDEEDDEGFFLKR